MVGGGLGPLLGVTPIDEHRPATGAAAGLDVPPAVADHEAGGQIDAEFLAASSKRPGLGLRRGQSSPSS